MLLNYTTQVPAARTASEIQELMRKHNAEAVVVQYCNKKVTGLDFDIRANGTVLSFRLPVNVEAVHKVLLDRRKRYVYDQAVREQISEQAERVAWRILKDWVEAQLALIDIGMVKLDQVFLPYALIPSGQTVYEAISARGVKLLGGPSA